MILRYGHQVGAADLTHKCGVRGNAIDWKAEYGRMGGVSDTKRLRILQMLEVAMLKELLSENGKARH